MNQYGIQAALRLQNILDRYEEYLLASRTPETADVHIGKLRPLFRAWDDVPMDQWTRGRFVSWLSSKRTGAKPWKPRSIQLTLTACGMFIEWCGKEGVAVPNFVDGIERPKSHRGKPIVYTGEETVKLLEASRGFWLELVIALAYYAGMRRGEIGHARWDEIDWLKNEILVHGTKSHKDRTIPLCEPLIDVLRRHEQPKGLLIRASLMKYGIYQSLRRAAERAKVTYKSPHKGRAGFLTTMLASGIDLATCRDLAGHGNISVTDYYLASTPERMRAAVKTLVG